MVELELLKRRKRPIARFEELETAPLTLVELVERVRLGIRLAKEGHRDDHDAYDNECRSEHQRQCQRVAGRPTEDARATSLRCSRRSGHSVMTEPMRKTSPASQMRLTSGFTNTRK
jgi:hypothetical protein